ncbi:ABC transporter substrate-binding protein [Blastococcus sp. BMG 814]|uniref:ABC transporter substrate-binding protein n=1 Tax=Blastococcus carthaginiensis TaxID=3050034 RepID=A0ABT9IAA3_9ACTN|nr:ABC transporter substrate-binding protein [Blastococcus carthaginiensis]MDP5182498.1 ABC transporter substrate-binding protein [Blastococcus carthaginiensis]
MSSMKMRRFPVGIAALAVVGLLSACGADGGGAGTSGASGTSGPSGAGDQELVRIGVGVDASYAPFFVAQERGMFEEAGLNVELVQFGRGGEAVQAIAGQQVQLAGNSDTTTITLLAQNPNLRAPLIYEESGEYVKVVGRPGIEEASDIQKMGVVPGISAYMAQKYFEANDVPLDDVEFVTAAPPELPTLAQRGDVDAYVLWEPWPTQGVEQGLQILSDTGSYGYSYVHWLVADGDWLDENQEQAAAIGEVLVDAAEVVRTDVEAAAEAVSAQTATPTDQAVSDIEQIDWEVRGFTEEDMESYEEQVQYFLDQGVLESPPALDEAILTDWFTENVEGA